MCEMGLTERTQLVGNIKRNFENKRSLIRKWQGLAAKCQGSGELPATIEECLEVLCRRHDCSLSQVSAGTGIPQDALVEMRRGKRRFNPTRVDDAHALENFFGCRPGELVERIRDNGRRRRVGVEIREEFKDVDRRVWTHVDPSGR